MSVNVSQTSSAAGLPVAKPDDFIWRLSIAQYHEMIQGGILIVALSMILLNLVTDLLYAVADPRIRYD